MSAAPFPRMFPAFPCVFGVGNMKDVDIHFMFPCSPLFPRIFIRGGVKIERRRQGGGR
jgi:hypothetical protein